MTVPPRVVQHPRNTASTPSIEAISAIGRLPVTSPAGHDGSALRWINYTESTWHPPFLRALGVCAGLSCQESRPPEAAELGPTTSSPSATTSSPSTTASAAATGAPDVSLDGAEFGALVLQLSEPERSFFSNNLVSNEADYLLASPWLAARRGRGGVFIGVGPEQNLSYVALLRPRFAFVLDIRRDNLLLHLLYKRAFEEARGRAEWLALLLGRRLPDTPADRTGKPGLNEATASVDDVIAAVERAIPDPAIHAGLVQRTLESMRASWGLDVGADDRKRLLASCQGFARLQLGARFESTSARPDFPTLGELLRARDTQGVQRSFLSRAEDFAFLQRFVREHRLVPLTGDFSGSHTLRALAQWLRQRHLTVDVFYTSNVEEYLLLDARWDAWTNNLRWLPHRDDSLILRTYSNRKRPLPGRPGGVFTPLGQSWVEVLGNGTPANYFELAMRSHRPDAP